ncbi:1-(5-phosphoribosyl)-5-amino-4-imidazole-carboxyl ate carboxylase [Collibacillus ludicampi]|jgi:NCAIR mutase (PurE)-related protein|uniref:1-(5-phosphoribosyl)-5-amino-4-imidazole-carboxyl ate carboxylase n=1 Tax=Collibacillus ludicampi TaxID=2771369 RepID=A0AAV4LC62_9BACL|nr:nickel pincer cofactor biosynthesis protein LarB [Collibacillus ludicampi]GIM45392.1 1-(5-phosphoribosyl)-5-amino-4-imidazole-carboxyl ate carboxylase [Collibacillus ludicampi]
MNLKEILSRVRNGQLSVEQAEQEIRGFEDLGFGKVDYAREARTGYPEVIFGMGKTPEQVQILFSRLYAKHGKVMVTRANEKMVELVQQEVPEAIYDPLSRLLTAGGWERRFAGTVAVVSAGTADLPVAEEAAKSAEWMGNPVDRIYDVGVAGIDRLLAQRERIQSATVIIVVAGMEGALASVVGGFVRRPVIAVPTSIGYGAHFSGLTPLLSMLTSCASGVTVVNIDNGFGAAVSASMIQQAILETAREPLYTFSEI